MLSHLFAQASRSGVADREGKRLPAREQQLLEKLRSLFVLQQLQAQGAELQVQGHITSQQRQWLDTQAAALCAELRPAALALVDAFDLSDHFLNSALGRYDGEKK